jgi:hypothetical protein
MLSQIAAKRLRVALRFYYKKVHCTVCDKKHEMCTTTTWLRLLEDQGEESTNKCPVRSPTGPCVTPPSGMGVGNMHMSPSSVGDRGWGYNGCRPLTPFQADSWVREDLSPEHCSELRRQQGIYRCTIALFCHKLMKKERH